MKNLTIIAFLALLSSFVLLVSCVSEKRKRANAVEFYRTHLQEFATHCNDKFPPELKYIQGKSLIKIDTLLVKVIVFRVKVLMLLQGLVFIWTK